MEATANGVRTAGPVVRLRGDGEDPARVFRQESLERRASLENRVAEIDRSCTTQRHVLFAHAAALARRDAREQHWLAARAGELFGHFRNACNQLISNDNI